MKNWIAQLGQNIQFVAFWAHLGVSALVVEHLSSGHPLALCVAILVGAGVKEFYFDARYEKDPPQTFVDNLEDWLGWGFGAVLGVFLV